MRKAARATSWQWEGCKTAQLKPIAEVCANLNEILAKARQSQGVRRVYPTVCLIHFLSGVKQPKR